MADKLTALTAATSWASGDLLYMVRDPAGTPVSRNITCDNFLQNLVCAANSSLLKSSTGYSLTGSNASSMIDLAGTWNTSGNPVALKIAMSNTASGATTKFASFLAGASGTTEVFSVDKAGNLTSLSLRGSTYISLWPNGTETSRISLQGTGCLFELVDTNTTVGGLAFGAAIGSPDVYVRRDGAANTLALRNGANAQCLNVYGTWTSASVYERAFMRYNVANTRYEIGAETLGGTASNTGLAFFTNGAERMSISTTGYTQVVSTDNTYGGMVITIPNAANLNGIGLKISGDTYGRVSVGLDAGTPFVGLGQGSAARDVFFLRDAANTLALRNAANAQTFRNYGTYTDASNYRRVALSMTTAGVATLLVEGAGTGASGNVLHISGLPTSNPGPGILWNNAGTPAIGT